MPTKVYVSSVPATSKANIQETFSYRKSGWAAIASGIIGILAAGSLITYLILRSSSQEVTIFLSRVHDGGVFLQFLLLIPVVFGLHKLSLLRPPGMSRTILSMGVGAVLWVVFCLLLTLPKVVAEVLYMFPQGVFGGWLMVVCWRLRNNLSPGLRWFGIIVGFGLALVGIFPLGYAIFVDTIILQIPAASEEAVAKIPITPANMVLHWFLWVGSPMGVLTLPFWTILIGRRLLRESHI
ncbi:hypothetical protein GXP67_35880 [Rhodocytophaga rosea]|uniref:Uncharacterized protein n=1 Tax=Rhodocytophaga rosea TaxID=2704465 RepID=A0A6C0GWJ3_9BACT|nr:hypothetical protein [Rhodocytophaga rosea]QHT71670.1 hypothetical protein GXP67_35880 [Rhodocytophaga rosea]